MKAFEEYRTKRIEEYNNQKKRRLELRCSKYTAYIDYVLYDITTFLALLIYAYINKQMLSYRQIFQV